MFDIDKAILNVSHSIDNGLEALSFRSKMLKMLLDCGYSIIQAEDIIANNDNRFVIKRWFPEMGLRTGYIDIINQDELYYADVILENGL